MTIKCSRILTRAAIKLLDVSGTRWAPTELLGDLNAGLTWLAINKPEAVAQQEICGLYENTPKQSILEASDRAFQLINPMYNAEIEGPGIGPSVRTIEINELDNLDPDWVTATGDAVEFVAYDPRSPLDFFIYPSVTESDKALAMLVAVAPDEVTDANDDLPVPDVYEEVLYLFVMGSALNKNSKSGRGPAGLTYLEMASRAIGAKVASAARTISLDPDRAQQTGADV